MCYRAFIQSQSGRCTGRKKRKRLASRLIRLCLQNPVEYIYSRISLRSCGLEPSLFASPDLKFVMKYLTYTLYSTTKLRTWNVDLKLCDLQEVQLLAQYFETWLHLKHKKITGNHMCALINLHCGGAGHISCTMLCIHLCSFITLTVTPLCLSLDPQGRLALLW